MIDSILLFLKENPLYGIAILISLISMAISLFSIISSITEDRNGVRYRKENDRRDEAGLPHLTWEDWLRENKNQRKNKSVGVSD